MTSRRSQYADDLTSLDTAAVPAYLDERSGLPGPRANLELVLAFAHTCAAATGLVEELLRDPDDFRRMCATVALGPRLLAAGSSSERARVVGALRECAGDDSWRVREGAAMAWQLVGDSDPDLMLSTMERWSDGGTTLERRAAVAALCEPRLLRDPEAARVAIAACVDATRHLAAVPAGARRAADARTLRQALGYCWSVAVAADPARGGPAFNALVDSADPDVAWVVRENRKKKRMPVLPRG